MIRKRIKHADSSTDRRSRCVRINLVAADRLCCEHARASLRGGPFVVTCSERMLPASEADLYVVPADAAAESLERAAGAPVIAHGPAELLRACFLLGCADYLRDPWDPVELAVRAQAVLDRAARRRSINGVEVRLDGSDLVGTREAVLLSPLEARVMGLLLRDCGRPVSREALCLVAWGRALPRRSRALDAHISMIRKKLRTAFGSEDRLLIKAFRGEGYGFMPEVRPKRA